MSDMRRDQKEAVIRHAIDTNGRLTTTRRAELKAKLDESGVIESLSKEGQPSSAVVILEHLRHVESLRPNSPHGGEIHGDENIDDAIYAVEKRLVDSRSFMSPKPGQAISYDKEKAVEAFKILQRSFLNKTDSTLNQSNRDLLGVICIYIAGGVRPVILVDHGNRMQVMDLNPNNGGQAIDAATTDVRLEGDNNATLGYNLAVMMQMADPRLLEWLAEYGFYQSPELAEQEQLTASSVPAPPTSYTPTLVR